MRRDDEAGVRRLQPRDVVEGPCRLGLGGGEIEEEDVPSLDGPFDPWYQGDAALARVLPRARITELSFVQSDGERVEPKGRGAIDQRHRAVRHVVDRVVPGVKVKVYFQHVRYQ